MMKETEKGYWIPEVIWGLEELSDKECFVLSIYRYYTIEGDMHCCMLSNSDICKMARLKDKSHFGKIKKHLKDLGYIRTDGGIKVTYLGVKGDGLKTIGDGLKTTNDGLKTTEEWFKNHCDDGLKTTHNKEVNKEEIKNNKDCNKDGNKAKLTNFEVLVAALPEEHKTQEKIDYLKDEVITGEMFDKLNKIDINDSGIKENWVKSISFILKDKFPVEYYVAPKVEPKKEEHNWWDD